MPRRTRAAGAPLVLALLAGLLALLGAVGVASPAAAFVDKDCSDFSTQKQAQDFYLANNPGSDPHRLDGSDNDGIVCESLPCPCSNSTTPTSGGSTTVVRQSGRIVKVVDGDTVDVRLANGTTRRVRMIGINTPERGRCGFTPATRSLQRLAPAGTRVVLVSDPSQDLRDRYGRLLRYVVRRSDTRDLNHAQVYRGMTRVYVYDNTPFRRITAYRKAMYSAKSNNRGLWRTCW